MTNEVGTPKSARRSVFEKELRTSIDVCRVFCAWAIAVIPVTLVFDYNYTGNIAISLLADDHIIEHLIVLLTVPFLLVLFVYSAFPRNTPLKTTAFRIYFDTIFDTARIGVGLGLGTAWGVVGGALLRHRCWNNCPIDLVNAHTVFVIIPVVALGVLICVGLMSIVFHWILDDIIGTFLGRLKRSRTAP